MEFAKLGKKLPQVASRYKYVILILVIGLALMLLPGGSEKKGEVSSAPQEQIKSEQTVGEQLSELLSKVSGAGHTQVMLTVRQGEKTVFQTDNDNSSSEQTDTNHMQTVIITDANRNQSGLVRQVNPPTYMGALVLCQGADEPTVRLAIVDAVSKVTGLGANQISVLKMN